ncbi:LamG domain-containing protein [bacterium]|nr:LamG domain-containing protein [bacterium]
MKKVVFLLCLIFCFSNVLSAKLLTHFEFEDSLEDSVGDNNGVLQGSNSATYQAGKNGKALVFNGTSNYMEFGKGDFDPRYSGRYSISMWVYSTEQASATNDNCYLGKHTETGGNTLLFGYWGNKLSFQIKNSVIHISASGDEPFNTWVHYVISAQENSNNGTTYVVIYKNGAQLWSGTFSKVLGTLNASDKPWVLGMDWDSSSTTDFFKGKMDNVRIYDWNITADEVKEIYFKESAKLHLNMDDTLNDSAGTVTGSQTGGVIFKQGMENRSAYFDGVDDYVNFGTGTTDPRDSGTTTKKYSISMWVKSDAQASSTNNNAYLVKHTESRADVFRFGYWNNKLILKIRNTSTDISTTAEPTSWTHYVITGTEDLSASTTTAAVYRDGSQIWTGTISAVLGSFTALYSPWILGRKPGSVGDFFQGEIDNVRFYQSVLNANAVKALYRSEFSGVRYCNTDQNSAGCTVVNNTVYNLGQYSWWISSTGPTGLPIMLPVSQTSIESVKVSEGWEVYLCTQTNNNGSCYYYDDGFYDNSNGLYSSLVNNVYSMTVQPSSFSAAKKFFGFRRADDTTNSPSGFAYLYEPVNFAAPSKANSSRRRLFLNSYDRYNFSTNLSNSIMRTNTAGSAELYGDVYLVLGNSTYGSKELMTSHNNFSKNLADYPELDFRNYYHNTNSAVLHGGTEEVGSVGVFFSDDFPRFEYLYPFCLNGVSDTIDDNPTRIECVGYNPGTDYSNKLPFYDSNNSSYNNDIDKFWEIVYGGNRQKFEKYADNYSLLLLIGHGNYSNSQMKIGVPHRWENVINDVTYYFPHIDIYSNYSDPYSQNLGKQNTRWMETSACNSMGYDGIDWADVGNLYYNILTRLNGIGGFRNLSYWGDSSHYYYNYWQDLTYNNKPVSKAWVDSWSMYTSSFWRNARFLTLEQCNCTQTNCFTYMKNDYFYNVSSDLLPQNSSGPMSQKTDLTNYNYYCFRDMESNFDNYSRGSFLTSQNYPDEFAAYAYDSLPNQIVEQLFNVIINEDTAKLRGNDRYNYKDAYVILNRKEKSIQAVMNRKMASFEDERESEETISDKFNEAKEMAETLTSIELEYVGISRDVNEAFEVGGNGESLGKMINSVAFVFRPVIDGVPIFSESIEVEYDAEGFYQLRSNVPYSVSKIRGSDIKSEEQVDEEAYSALGKEEDKIIAYVLNEKGEFILSVIAKDDANNTFLTISLEANND